MSFIPAATQAQQEAASSTAVYVSPGTQQYHPSAPKAWCSYAHVSGVPTIQRSYNVASITDTGTGDAKINLTISLSSLIVQFVSVITPQLVNVGGGSTGSIMEVTTTNLAGLAADTAYATSMFMGDLP